MMDFETFAYIFVLYASFPGKINVFEKERQIILTIFKRK